MTFFDSLQPDDVVAATVASSTKLHLIRVVRRVTPSMVRGTPSGKAMTELFEGRVFCTANPRFWWRPVEDLQAHPEAVRCWHCFARWKKAGRPAIKGAPAPAGLAPADVGQPEDRLPWGWAAVPPTGHPHDLPAGAPDPAEDEPGERRTELFRWERGNRYVRITQSLDDTRFCSRYGSLQGEPAEEQWQRKASQLADVKRSALTIMALGGTPAPRTNDINKETK